MLLNHILTFVNNCPLSLLSVLILPLWCCSFYQLTSFWAIKDNVHIHVFLYKNMKHLLRYLKKRQICYDEWDFQVVTQSFIAPSIVHVLYRPHVGRGHACACVCVYMRHCAYLLKWPGPVCYPGQANRFWAHADWLSSLWKPARCRGCMWGTGREKEHRQTH